jgi:hypothetical protein
LPSPPSFNHPSTTTTVPLFRSTPLSAITFSFSPSLLAAVPVVDVGQNGWEKQGNEISKVQSNSWTESMEREWETFSFIWTICFSFCLAIKAECISFLITTTISAITTS